MTYETGLPASPALPYFDAETIAAATPWPALIAAVREAFGRPHVAPDRHIHTIEVPGEVSATALLMPAWIEGEVYGAKLANIFPSNNRRRQPAVNSVYVLFSARTGAPLAIMDGTELTGRRTAAASALMASYLARPDSRNLLIVGTGRLAPLLFEAHCAVRDISSAIIWGRNADTATALAARLSARSAIPVRAEANLETALEAADIVSTATISTSPLVRGRWVRPGTHLDLVGAFRPDMCEVDAEAVHRSEVYVDTLSGAKTEAGDLIQAHDQALFAWQDVKGDMAQLCSGSLRIERKSDSVTLFKSVGAAIEDLAAAELVYRSNG